MSDRIPGFPMPPPVRSADPVDLPDEIRDVLTDNELAMVEDTPERRWNRLLVDFFILDPLSGFILVALVAWLAKRIRALLHKPGPSVPA